MRWPWVSRREHERQCQSRYSSSNAAFAQVVDGLRGQLLDERKRYDALLDKYHALKLQGAVVVEPPMPPVIVAAAPADPVREKIREQVRANPGITGLGGYLSDYARELRDERNMAPAQIVEALGKWESSEDYSAAVDSYVETAPTTDEAIAEVIA